MHIIIHKQVLSLSMLKLVYGEKKDVMLASAPLVLAEQISMLLLQTTPRRIVQSHCSAGHQNCLSSVATATTKLRVNWVR
ncbi:hypothetical protein D3C71_999650 [compost metagenome]